MAKSKSARRNTVTAAVDRASTALPNPPARMADSEIARRAYDLYLARGCAHGHDVEDWLQAERELRGVGRLAVA
ncbi:MAG: DUF2934 domain-containing protein [Acidobacteriia bacterium]|nr:DUF2934 domain-containing protein [Terriglobia bacterium]